LLPAHPSVARLVTLCEAGHMRHDPDVHS
jgi:hypothetical protein